MHKTAIITGASSGIGKSVSIGLSNLGYRIILVARSLDKLDAISQEIHKLGGKSIAVPLDLSIPKSITNLKNLRISNYGNIEKIIVKKFLNIFL